MQAIILCGGLGSRLDPITQTIPKPMVPLGEKPHLEYQLRWLKRNGITDIILSTGYLAKSIEEYFGDGSPFGVKLSYCEDGETLLGTAGALKNCEKHITSNAVLVINGDILSDICIKEVIDTHTAHKQPITLTLIDQENTRDYGTVKIGATNRALEFVEKGANREKYLFINAGIYVINKEVLYQVEEQAFSMLEKDIFPAFVNAHMVQCHLCSSTKDYWIDIGTWERYLKAKEDVESGEKKF